MRRGFAVDRVDEALAAFPALTALTYTPKWRRPGIQWLSAVATDARRRCTSQRTVRLILWDAPFDPWRVPVAGGGQPGDRPPWAVVCSRQRIRFPNWDEVETLPTTETLDDVDDIATFASSFLGGWGGPPGDPPLPHGVAADVAFLRHWALPDMSYWGPDDVYRFIAAPAASRVARATVADGGGGGDLLTGRQVLDDLRAGEAFAAHPAVMGAIDTVAPPYMRGGYGTDQLHADLTKQHLMACTGDAEEARWAKLGVDGGPDVVACRAPYKAALEALRSHVVGGHLYCVSLHTEKEELPSSLSGPDGPGFYCTKPALNWVGFHCTKPALNWVVGVSPDSGFLLGAIAMQKCHGMCG